MHSESSAATINRSHEERKRCRACGFRSSCDQRLP
jgi:hypothetical protein